MVFDKPRLVSFAAEHGFSVFYITGRPQSQTAATVKDLTSAGYAAPTYPASPGPSQGATARAAADARATRWR